MGHAEALMETASGEGRPQVGTTRSYMILHGYSIGILNGIAVTMGYGEI